MSDLIKRDDVINLLCQLRVDNVTVNGKRITKFINELPTAYDIDKVVEKFEKMSYTTTDLVCGGTFKAIRTSSAIEIVRKGGAT